MRTPTTGVVAPLTGLWGARVGWLAIAITGALSLGDALGGRSPAVRGTVTVGGWFVWGIGVLALVVPSPLGLTVIRLASGVAFGAAAASWVGGASPAAGGAFLAVAAVSGLLVGGADLGHQCVQASAYGDEQRFLLRPPAAFLPPMFLAGLLWATAVIAAPLLLAARRWAIGGVVAGLAVLLSWLVIRRLNTLARRWLVLVPAGVVVHDQVVLGETLMVRRADVVSMGLALDGTEAADLTGPAAGHAVEVQLRAMTNALLAATKHRPTGTALHLQSFIVAPTRPGAVLRAAYPAMPPPST